MYFHSFVDVYPEFRPTNFSLWEPFTIHFPRWSPDIAGLGELAKALEVEFGEINSPVTPLKINMEHNHGGLEDHFPFQMGDLRVPS